MKTKFLPIAALAALLLAAWTLPCQAQQHKPPQRIHPMNQQLVQMGIMPVPEYYPEIPRITADVAYSLYLSGKALFVLISYIDDGLIVGGIHLTEGKAWSIDPNTLPFQPGQVLVVYCP